MSDQPNVSTSWMRKKVAGIPVVYLAGGFVVILAALAWKMKPSASDAPAADVPVESADDTILQESEQYPALPLGTVTTVPGQTAPAGDLGNASIQDNDEWLRRAVAFLIQKGNNPGEAQAAMQKYLDGSDLSFQEGKMRDDAVRELGIPPYPITIGKTLEQPARIQGTLPRTHVVKVPAEDSAGELAALYYGAGKSWAPIANANGGRVKFNIGESVKIPVYPVAAAVKQGTPPLTHIVKSPTEDSAGELANLYYGPGRSYWPIQNANAGRVKFSVGQSVKIPVYPKPGP